MSTDRRHVAIMPLPQEAFEQSFIGEDELAAKSLGKKQVKSTNDSGEKTKSAKRRRVSEERLTVKRLKEDSLPTPWKTGSYTKGPLEVERRERLVREEKYRISFDTSMESFGDIKLRMAKKGWILEYVTVNNAGGHLRVCAEVPTLICHNSPGILEYLEAVVMKEEEYILSMERDGQGEPQG